MDSSDSRCASSTAASMRRWMSASSTAAGAEPPDGAAPSQFQTSAKLVPLRHDQQRFLQRNGRVF